MALTNFAALTAEQKTAWSLAFWHHARTNAFISKFAGKGPNAMIQQVTDLTKSAKGTRAVMTLLADLLGDGVMGDTKLEDNEEALNSFDTVIQIDQIRHANRIEGRMADQKSIVNFRNASKDALGYWIADRLDQMAFLSLSSLPYTLNTNGSLRPVLAAGRNLSDLEFAPDGAVAPTANRRFYLNSAGLSRGTGTDAAAGTLDTLTYKSLVQLKAAAKDSYIRPIKSGAGEDIYHVFVTPMGMADLRLDPDFIANVRHAGLRGESNSLFSGASSVMVDGLIVHEFHHVYDTSKAASGSRFGATGVDHGQRVLLCGAQALGMADIGNAEWVEDTFDYENQLGISIAKMVGFLKPQFKGNLSSYTTKEDFGVITLDTGLSVLA
jgi:N4-gp56 family major capsid protein